MYSVVFLTFLVVIRIQQTNIFTLDVVVEGLYHGMAVCCTIDSQYPDRDIIGMIIITIIIVKHRSLDTI